jgi:hypothetical protein
MSFSYKNFILGVNGFGFNNSGNGGNTTIVNAYTQVATFADLPDSATQNDKIYVVLNPTGFWPFTKKSGFYYSNGLTWRFIDSFEDQFNNITTANVPDSLDKRYVTEAKILFWDSKQPAGNYLIATDEIIAQKRTKSAINSISYAASITINFSLADTHIIGIITGNLTINTSNVSPGQTGVIIYTMNGTGGYIIALGTGTWSKIEGSLLITDCKTASTTYLIYFNIIGTEIFYNIVKKA